MSISLALPENDTLMAGKTMSQWCRAVVLTRRRGGQLTEAHSPDQHLGEHRASQHHCTAHLCTTTRDIKP
jgi:hypothetical protein